MLYSVSALVALILKHADTMEEVRKLKLKLGFG